MDVITRVDVCEIRRMETPNMPPCAISGKYKIVDLSAPSESLKISLELAGEESGVISKKFYFAPPDSQDN